MQLEDLPTKEKLELSITSTDQQILKELALAPEMSVRRALLRNHNITTEIVNILAEDVSVNVSFPATKHPKCTETRKFDSYDTEYKCVTCKVDERKLRCDSACPNEKK